MGEDMNTRLTATLLITWLCALLLAPISAVAGDSDGIFIDPQLKDEFARTGTADLLVYLRDKADLTPAHGMDWEARGWFVYQALTEHAELTQAHVRRHLDETGASYQSFWIDNVIHVEQAQMSLLNSLAELPGLAAIISPPIGYIPDPEERPEDDSARAPISSIVQIRAPEVWAMGFRGDGSVVGIIDSGTRHTHVALVNQYRGHLGGSTFDHNYNWYDVGGSTTPQWPHAHGTHVTGTAIGDDGAGNEIGVAPEAKWVSCLGCTSTGCPSANLLGCAQFMAAPTDLAGNNADPDLRPDVVNNSWGSCQQSYDPWYQGVVDAWIAAGVVPVFANGNAGNCGYSSPPGLNTVGNPGRYGSVLGVGSSGNNNGLYANHSNWGPTDNPNDGTNSALPDPMGHPEVKPNVIAPGVSIFSSVSSSDTAFQSTGWTGTSMSAPAVAGLVALMWEAAPPLRGDYATTGTLIMQTARPVPYDSGGPNVGPGDVPNHASGWGEIDAVEAVLAALAFAGPRGTVNGQVTDLNSGLPIADATVFVENTDPDGAPASWSTTTDASGNYSLTLSEGFRDFDFSAFGYFPHTEPNVEIIEDETTVVNVQLEAAPAIEVSGIVSDFDTGWPLHARISIAGVPSSPIYTDPADGSYAVTLPAGSSYDFDVHVLSGGYISDSRAVDTSAGTDLTEHFELDADLIACSAPGYIDVAPLAYAEDFETNDGGFAETVASGSAMWEWGTPSAWPAACAQGSNCWGTNLGGNYPHSSNAYVTSPVISLAGFSAPLTLTWDQANHIETFTWDQGLVELSIDGGAWTTIWQNPTTTVQTDWRELSHDLSAAAGQDIQLRWRLTSDGSVHYAGLYFDNIRIQGEPDCVAQAGELVSGRVTDANTGDALIGADILVDGAAAGTSGVSEDPALGEGAYLVFVPAGNSTVAASFPGYETAELTDDFIDGNARRVDFGLGAGQLSALPSSVVHTLTIGETDSSVLDLVNDGTAEASFTAEVLALVREDFETDFPPTDWVVENLGGACVWQRNDEVGRPNYAGGEGFSAAADSDDCGSGTTMDSALISPSVSVGATSTLDFVVSYNHLNSSRLDVDVSTDGDNWTTIQSYTADLHPAGPGAPQSLSLAAYSGQSIQVRFRYVGGWDWWAQVDQIEIASVVDWLEVNPTAGTVGMSTLPLTLNYDAGAPSITTPGEYTASVIIDNDTPYGRLAVPVTMVVEAGADQAQLVGQISSMGYCDDNPAAAGGASVEVIGQNNTYSLTADSNGMYEVWLMVDEAPLTIEASAANHLDASVSGVSLPAGGTQVEDLAMRWLRSCLDIDSDPIAVTLALGGSTSRTFNMGNTGAGSLDFDILEIDNGFTPLGAGASLLGTIGDEWEIMAPLPSGRVFNAVVADDNGYVYVIGGTSDGGASTPTTTNYRYNTATNDWDTMAPLPVALDSIYGVVIDNRIYIPGAAGTATTYVYDIAADSWSTLPANNGYSARSQYSALAIGTDLYVLGGIVAAANASTPEVWILDTISGDWSAGVSMQRTRTSFAAGVVNGEIYAAGGVAFPGFSPDMTTEYFDGAAWSFVAGVPTDGGLYTRWSYNATSVGSDGLWLAGGRRDADWNVLDHAGYYSPDTDSWVTSPTVPTLNQARVYTAGATATDGNFYVIGGRDGAGTVAYASNERLYVGAMGPSEVIWLDQEPKFGSIVGDGGSQEIEVMFDAGMVTEPGIYNATVRVVSNDPQQGTVNIPVSMEVLDSDPPVIGVDPLSLSASLAEGQSDDQDITISNTGEANLNWFIDDTTVGCELPGWASVNPESGSVVDGDSEVATVSFDATGLAPDVYSATLCVASNDPNTPVVEVELELTVIDTMATVEGHVFSLGYCGDNPAPAAGAGILIQGQFGNFAGTADGDGFYSISLPADETPVSVTATALDHLADTETDVDLTAGATVELDFDLVLEAPCATVDPASLEFYEVMTTATQNLTVANVNGAASLTWSVDSGAACYDAGIDTWLSLSSTGDTMAAGASQVVEVTVDSAGLTPDLYETVLCLGTNDSEAEELLVPVTFDLRSDAIFWDRFED
jgi:hypothetical protein